MVLSMIGIGHGCCNNSQPLITVPMGLRIHRAVVPIHLACESSHPCAQGSLVGLVGRFFLLAMASDQLYLFTALAAFNTALQEQLQAAASPQEIVAIAAEKGYQISIEQLRLLSYRLNETYWVWSGRGERWRQRFFADAELSLQLG
jgi:predicted ribosomally synthesized peptide with nif11-like leader